MSLCESVMTYGEGTLTNTLSVCVPFGMMSEPLKVIVFVGFSRFNVIESNVNVPLFGAITKCQNESVLFGQPVAALAVVLFSVTVCVDCAVTPPPVPPVPPLSAAAMVLPTISTIPIASAKAPVTRTRRPFVVLAITSLPAEAFPAPR
jgi:hypothetical protein